MLIMSQYSIMFGACIRVVTCWTHICNALGHVIYSGVSGQSVCNALVHVIYSRVSGQSVCNALVHVIYSGVTIWSVSV